jgi:enoyl-CoA hydratase/carnithine racemase
MVLDESVGAVRHLTLNRPDQRNAINREMIDGLTAGLDAACEDENCRVIVLRGAGGNFSAGRDLRAGAPANTLPEYLERDVAWTDIFKRLGLATKPTVAVVEGYAVAGGMTLAMACDFVVAEQGAKFGALEMRNDFPAAVNTPLLAKLAAPRIGLEILMTGSLFDAPRLHAAGLINHVAQGAQALNEMCDQFIAHLASLDPHAVAMTKELHRAAQSMPLANALDMGKYANALLAASGRIGEAEKRYRKPK